MPRLELGKIHSIQSWALSLTMIQRFQKPKSNLSNEITLQKETDCDFQLKLPVNYISNHKHLIKEILITYLQIILILTNIKVWLHITTFHSFLAFCMENLQEMTYQQIFNLLMRHVDDKRIFILIWTTKKNYGQNGSSPKL